MNTVVTIVLAAIPSVISVFVAYKINKMSKKSDECEALRRRESVLILKNIVAVGTLAEKTAICVKNGQVNGDLDDAVKYRTEQKHALEDYLIDVNAKKMVAT